MSDETTKINICPRCDQETTNESSPCDECIEEVANDLNIPEHTIIEYAKDIGDDDLSDIEEAYEGKYRSDEDFARETAESIGLIDGNMSWPHSCIDWEWAASELMQDYFEIDGYYFRHI